ncbi:hypothetical protein AB0L75_29485 [Streptomyces sp. NPDC052101]|uniref:hypothetical protein n=1 Tax=Streptomyces sp. NPDC052101 TaxID=3155763 RepID=UPI003445D2B2
MDRFHRPGSHGLLFADATDPAHDPDLGTALRQVHQHLADTLADLLSVEAQLAVLALRSLLPQRPEVPADF